MDNIYRFYAEHPGDSQMEWGKGRRSGAWGLGRELERLGGGVLSLHDAWWMLNLPSNLISANLQGMDACQREEKTVFLSFAYSLTRYLPPSLTHSLPDTLSIYVIPFFRSETSSPSISLCPHSIIQYPSLI